MKTRIKHLIAGLTVISGLLLAPLAAQPAAAIDVFSGACSGSTDSVCGAKNDDATKVMRSIINTTLFVLGFIAVIMIIIGGIRYATSNGDSSSIKGAKDTIMYAVIGLVVAIMSFAIVNFVITNIK